MKQTILFLLMISLMGVAGCTGSNAETLFETAELEELQKNNAHAAQLYGEILEKYPDSRYARKARERLKLMKGDGPRIIRGWGS
jgi:outer membrane protein assembly factor BamD (BamD/ComL family)